MMSQQKQYKQANLVFDAEAFERVSKVKNRVKVQAKHEPEVTKIFN